jgi:hypothetical protein
MVSLTRFICVQDGDCHRYMCAGSCPAPSQIPCPSLSCCAPPVACVGQSFILFFFGLNAVQDAGHLQSPVGWDVCHTRRFFLVASGHNLSSVGQDGRSVCGCDARGDVSACCQQSRGLLVWSLARPGFGQVSQTYAATITIPCS